MCRHAPATGWVPFPCRHLPTTFAPGRFPYPPFPVSRIKTRADPVAVPSCAPSPLLLIPSFSLLRLLSNGTFLHKLTSPHSFLFHPVALVISDRQPLCHSFLLIQQSYRAYIYIHTIIYTHTNAFQASCWSTRSKSTAPAFTNIRNISSVSRWFTSACRYHQYL